MSALRSIFCLLRVAEALAGYLARLGYNDECAGVYLLDLAAES